MLYNIAALHRGSECHCTSDVDLYSTVPQEMCDENCTTTTTTSTYRNMICGGSNATSIYYSGTCVRHYSHEGKRGWGGSGEEEGGHVGERWGGGGWSGYD